MMYQTLGQRRNNWRRAVCEFGPDGKHVQDVREMTTATLATCLYCRLLIRYEHHPNAMYEVGHWMAPTQIILVEWP